MRKLLLLALALLAPPAWGQAVTGPTPTAPAGAYNTVAPTCTTGQFCFLQVDVNGNLKTSATITPSGTQNVNLTQILGAAPSLTNPLWVFPATGATWVVGPQAKTTTQAKVTVAVTNTYQQALASSASRAGCTLQYIAVAGTKGYVFFGATPADTTTSFQLTNGQSINCSLGEGIATDAVQVTATGTDIFIVSNQ